MNDNLQLFNFYSDKVYAIFERIVIPKLKEAQNNDRPYKYIFDLIEQEFRTRIFHKLDNGISKTHPIASKFYHRRDLYYKTDDKTAKILLFQNEIYGYFQKIDLSLFRPFIIDLAINDAVDNIERHLKEYFCYHELVFQVKRYDYFYLKPFVGMHYEDSSEFNELLDLKYPDRIKKRKAQLKKEQQSKSSHIELSSNNNLDNKMESITDKFSDDERMLIAHVVFYSGIKKTKFELNLGDFLKLAKIIGSYKNDSIFDEKLKNNLLYKKANVGLEYSISINNKKQLLKSTISKLDGLNLKVISEILSDKNKTIDL